MTLLEALMHGAGGGPGGEVLPPHNPTPKFTPNTTPTQVTDMPAETVEATDPSQLMSVYNPAQMAAGKPAPKTSRMRAENSAPVAAQAAVNPAEAPTDAPQVKDAIADMLAGKKAEAEVDRDSAKANALKSKDMNDGEKIFTALMAVLPGLVGAVGGGAIAGGAGAAAGAAGGLSGGANAVGMMMGEKEQLRQEALDEAKAAQGRVDQVGQQQFGHAEKLQGQEFQVGERKAADQMSIANREDQQQFTQGENTRQMGHSTKMQIMKERHDMAMLKEQNNMMLQKALMAAEAKGGGDVKEFQANAAMFAGDVAIAADEITKYTSAIQGSPIQGVVAGQSWLNLARNKDTQRFATAVARLVNAYGHGTSGTAISEQEWEMAKAQFIPLASDTPETLQMKEANRKDAALAFYQKAGPAQAQVQQRLQQYGLQNGGGQQSSSSSADAEAVQWARANPNDQYAKQILQANGIQ